MVCACRFVLHPGSVPEQYRLAAQMGALRAQCRGAESSGGCSFAAGDFADVSLVAEDRSFRLVHWAGPSLAPPVWILVLVQALMERS